MMVVGKYALRKAIITCVFVFVASNCSEALSSVGSIELDTELSAQDFIVASAHAVQEAQGKPYLSNVTLMGIPSVYVYSPMGEIIYEGGAEDRDKNYAILQAMPESIMSLKPLLGRPNLKAMLDIVPAFRAHEDEILKCHHYVVYAITLKTDHVTKTEQKVMALRARLKGTSMVSIDSLIVRVVQ